jgi:hypothetical protein
MNIHFEQQRNVADHASDKLNRIWFHKMKRVFKEIDEKGRCVQRAKRLFFLDLGLVFVVVVSLRLSTDRRGTMSDAAQVVSRPMFWTRTRKPEVSVYLWKSRRAATNASWNRTTETLKPDSACFPQTSRTFDWAPLRPMTRD